LFSQKEFVEASRDFVCVRLESFENKEYHDMVRSFLNGRFANTAFCILAPDGKERLTRAGRGPSHGLSSRGPGPGAEKEESNAEIIEAMEDIAKSYRPRGKEDELTLQDFHTFRQALNVASGDQRLLLFVAASAGDQEKIADTLKPVFADEAVIGRYHLDFANAATDAEWADVVDGVKGKSGLVIIRSGQFGLKGKVMDQLPLSATGVEIKAALSEANAEFAKEEVRKVYGEHVSQGRRTGVTFENEMPYGEDRDGDGEIDHRGGAGKGGEKGKGKGGKGKGERPPR